MFIFFNFLNLSSKTSSYSIDRQQANNRRKRISKYFQYSPEEKWATDYFFGNVMRHNGC